MRARLTLAGVIAQEVLAEAVRVAVGLLAQDASEVSPQTIGVNKRTNMYTLFFLR